MKFLVIISSLSFLFYGVLVLSTDHMALEFKRYRLTRFKTLTGFLEIVGGVGSLLGLLNQPILMLSTIGLSLLMFLGVCVRIKVRDPWPQIIPAFILMLINIYIFYDCYLSYFNQ